MLRISSSAFLPPSRLTAAIRTSPESSMSIWAPVSSVMRLMILPPGPMTSRILSGGMFMMKMRGAYGDISVRGADRAVAMMSRIVSRPRRARSRASRITWLEIPPILVSIWKAVIPSRVPVTLKSMSPR